MSKLPSVVIRSTIDLGATPGLSDTRDGLLRAEKNSSTACKFNWESIDEKSSPLSHCQSSYSIAVKDAVNVCLRRQAPWTA
eukprot:1337804-Pyramimonas_sp.AAC.1